MWQQSKHIFCCHFFIAFGEKNVTPSQNVGSSLRIRISSIYIGPRIWMGEGRRAPRSTEVDVPRHSKEHEESLCKWGVWRLGTLTLEGIMQFPAFLSPFSIIYTRKKFCNNVTQTSLDLLRPGYIWTTNRSRFNYWILQVRYSSSEAHRPVLDIIFTLNTLNNIYSNHTDHLDLDLKSQAKDFTGCFGERDHVNNMNMIKAWSCLVPKF